MTEQNNEWMGEEMSKHLKNMLLVVISVIITAIGASITVKANVGVGAYEALNMSINQLSGIKIGTLAILLNVTCIAIQWFLMRKDFSLRQLFQIPVTLIVGQVMNLMLYTVFSGLTIDQYWMKIAMVILGGIIAAVGVGSMMALNYISMPLEGACMAFSIRFGVNFGKVRQIVDMLLIAAALLITFSTDTPITVREGTIISMLLFPPSMNFVYEKIKSSPAVQDLSVDLD